MRAPILTFKRARTLRRQMTLREVILWQKVRGGRLEGLRFRRQHPIGPYVLDFYCPSARLAVEVDGLGHDAPAGVRHDERRDRWLAERGIRVLRFLARDVLEEETLRGILSTILAAASALVDLPGGATNRGASAVAAPSTAFGGPPPPLRGGG